MNAIFELSKKFMAEAATKKEEAVAKKIKQVPAWRICKSCGHELSFRAPNVKLDNTPWLGCNNFKHSKDCAKSHTPAIGTLEHEEFLKWAAKKKTAIAYYTKVKNMRAGTQCFVQRDIWVRPMKPASTSPVEGGDLLKAGTECTFSRMIDIGDFFPHRVALYVLKGTDEEFNAPVPGNKKTALIGFADNDNEKEDK